MNRKLLGIGFSALVTISISLAYYTATTSDKSEIQNHPGWMDFYLNLKSGGTGVIPEGLVAQWFKADKQNSIRFKKAENSLTNITEMGPANVGGRTRSVIIDYSNPNRILTAGISGGIWISENNGSSWKNVNDTAPTLSATSITQSPFNPDVFYYGTGEPMGNSANIGGMGLFRSTDGANTFEHLTHTNTTPLSKIWDVKHSLVYDSTVYVATDGGGLWRSKNGGQSFERIYSSSRKIHEIKAFSDSTIMVAIDGFGIVKIYEDSLNNERLNANWPTSGFGRISFDYCKKYPQVMYAHLANTSGSAISKSFKTSDGGASWQSTTLPAIGNYSFAWYCFKLSVSPEDSNFVFSASVDPIYSKNGGLTWLDAGDSHADYHEVTWYPNGKDFLVGNDGGVYKYNTTNPRSFISLNNGLNITQFYAGNYASAGQTIIAGAQDNGTHITVDGNKNFIKAFGGDGAFCHIHQQNDETRYLSWQNLNMYRQTNSGNTSISNYIKSAIGGDSYTWFINPFEVNPLDGNQLYVPTKKQVFRSLNGGTNWIALTADLIGDTYAVGLSNSKNPIAYIGGSGSRLYRVDSAATATGGKEVDLFNTKVTNFLGSTIGCIEVDPNNEGTIYCGLVNISTKSRIWKITNANTDKQEWFDISSNLPQNLPVNWIEVDPQNSNHIYIATDYGLYSSLNDGASWQKEYRIPNVPIDQIKLRSSDRKLFIFTHGRGAWSADLLANPVASISSLDETDISIYPNPASDYIHIKGDFEACNLYSTDGKLVARTKEQTLKVAELPNGIYFVELVAGSKKSVKKILVTH